MKYCNIFKLKTLKKQCITFILALAIVFVHSFSFAAALTPEKMLADLDKFEQQLITILDKPWDKMTTEQKWQEVQKAQDLLITQYKQNIVMLSDNVFWHNLSPQMKARIFRYIKLLGKLMVLQAPPEIKNLTKNNNQAQVKPGQKPEPDPKAFPFTTDDLIKKLQEQQQVIQELIK